MNKNITFVVCIFAGEFVEPKVFPAINKAVAYLWSRRNITEGIIYAVDENSHHEIPLVGRVRRKRGINANLNTKMTLEFPNLDGGEYIWKRLPNRFNNICKQSSKKP